MTVKRKNKTVPDPDLEIRGGRQSSRPLGKGGGGGRWPENIFLALRASVWSKTKGGGRAPWAPSLDPPRKKCLKIQL